MHFETFLLLSKVAPIICIPHRHRRVERTKIWADINKMIRPSRKLMVTSPYGWVAHNSKGSPICAQIKRAPPVENCPSR